MAPGFMKQPNIKAITDTNIKKIGTVKFEFIKNSEIVYGMRANDNNQLRVLAKPIRSPTTPP